MLTVSRGLVPLDSYRVSHLAGFVKYFFDFFRLFSTLAFRLVGWLVGWLVGCRAGPLDSRLASLARVDLIYVRTHLGPPTHIGQAPRIYPKKS